jgi:hypothetical protein
MAKISQINFQNISDLPTLTQYLSNFAQSVQGAINGNLTYVDNLVASLQTVTFPGTANTNVQIAHGLPKTPTMYLVGGLNAAGTVYNGTSPVFGATFANLQASTASLVATILFM